MPRNYDPRVTTEEAARQAQRFAGAMAHATAGGGRTPLHYVGSGITCDEALASMLGAPANAEVPPMALVWWATAFKYVWRMFAKGQGEGDCAKARDCLLRLADEMGWDGVS